MSRISQQVLVQIMFSRTFTLTGTTSVLIQHYFPPIQLPKDMECFICLLSFESFNAIPNVDEKNNKLHIVQRGTIEIPTGTYELKDLANYFETHINENIEYNGVHIDLKANNNTLKSRIKCTHSLDFTKTDSIGKLLGFSPRLVTTVNRFAESDRPVDIFRVNAIRLDCNISSGAFNNGQLVHTLHEFFPTAPAGFKIVESPQNLIYLPIINTTAIDYLKVEILDQDGNLVNFRGERVTVRVHVKGVKKNGY